MKRIFSKLRQYFYWLADRKGFFLAKLFGPKVPLFPLSFLPDGFSVSGAGKTGLFIIDNFVRLMKQSI
jgi:hypothetical protein